MPELIDRQALIKDMCNNKTEAKCPCYPNCYPCDFSEARRIIDIQPTIEPEVRHGRWMQRSNGEYHCTNCGREERHIFQKNYCPSCGAYMREEGVNNE